MKTLTNFLALILMLSLISCKSSFTAEDQNKLITLQTQLNEKPFAFKATTARPFNTQALNNVANGLLIRTGNSASRVNLQGGNYTLEMGEEKAVFSLPFYGEQRIAGGYNYDNVGYNFTGDLKNIQSSISDKDRCIIYNFTTSNSAETLEIELKVYSLNFVQLNIDSSHRTYMKYDGNIEWLQEVE